MAPQSLSLQMHPMVHAMPSLLHGPSPIISSPSISYHITSHHITSHQTPHYYSTIIKYIPRCIYFICSGHGRQRIASSVSHCLISGPHNSRIEGAPPRPHPQGPFEIVCRTRFAFISRMDPTPHIWTRPCFAYDSSHSHRVSPQLSNRFYPNFISILYCTFTKRCVVTLQSVKISSDPYARKKWPVRRKEQTNSWRIQCSKKSHNVKYNFGRFYVHHMYALQ